MQAGSVFHPFSFSIQFSRFLFGSRFSGHLKATRGLPGSADWGTETDLADIRRLRWRHGYREQWNASPDEVTALRLTSTAIPRDLPPTLHTPFHNRRETHFCAVQTSGLQACLDVVFTDFVSSRPTLQKAWHCERKQNKRERLELHRLIGDVV